MNSKTASRPALDRSDERVQHNDGLFGVVRAQFNRIKTGDLGTAPVIAGLILYSLLENAADALNGHPKARIALSATANGDTLVLRLEDNGPGIRPANREKLFTFGFTTKSNSLGSALAFARVRAAQMGATLRLAANQPERGTAFELELPANERAYARITTDILNAQPT